MKRYSERDTQRRAMEAARLEAYAPVTRMTRAERRTAHGRMMVAEAEARALRAENEILKQIAGIE